MSNKYVSSRTHPKDMTNAETAQRTLQRGASSGESQMRHNESEGLTPREMAALRADAAELRRARPNIIEEGPQQADIVVNKENSRARVEDNRILRAREQAKKVSY